MMCGTPRTAKQAIGVVILTRVSRPSGGVDLTHPDPKRRFGQPRAITGELGELICGYLAPTLSQDEQRLAVCVTDITT